MRTVSSVRAMQRLALQWRRRGKRVAFVPTMGYLHAGHISLIRRARRLAGRQGIVVVSIFVNPTQFAPNEDLSRYPRDLKRDARLCREAGADLIFHPSDSQMYPGKTAGLYSTFVLEERLSSGMESLSRPTHFKGVTTVVAKLFNIVLPDVAVFGAKDFQQAAIIQRMVKDLNFPLKIVVAPTIREKDGLAMSSRNKYLEGDLRTQAVALSQSLEKTRELIKNSSTGIAADLLKQQLKEFIEEQPATRVDYIEFFNPQTLEPVTQVQRGVHMSLAVFVGNTRLIDNALLK
jgi:pantoate--beta-alanine ligase